MHAQVAGHCFNIIELDASINIPMAVTPSASDVKIGHSPRVLFLGL